LLNMSQVRVLTRFGRFGTISYRLEMFVAETELKCTRDRIIFLMPHHLKNTL